MIMCLPASTLFPQSSPGRPTSHHEDNLSSDSGSEVRNHLQQQMWFSVVATRVDSHLSLARRGWKTAPIIQSSFTTRSSILQNVRSGRKGEGTHSLGSNPLASLKKFQESSGKNSHLLCLNLDFAILDTENSLARWEPGSRKHTAF